MARLRAGGPTHAKRPFTPLPGTEKVEDQVAEALEHIARALSAIDHNLEVLAASVSSIATVLPKLKL